MDIALFIILNISSMIIFIFWAVYPIKKNDGLFLI